MDGTAREHQGVENSRGGAFLPWGNYISGMAFGTAIRVSGRHAHRSGRSSCGVALWSADASCAISASGQHGRRDTSSHFYGVVSFHRPYTWTESYHINVSRGTFLMECRRADRAYLGRQPHVTEAPTPPCQAQAVPPAGSCSASPRMPMLGPTHIPHRPTDVDRHLAKSASSWATLARRSTSS